MLLTYPYHDILLALSQSGNLPVINKHFLLNHLDSFNEYGLFKREDSIISSNNV